MDPQRHIRPIDVGQINFQPSGEIGFLLRASVGIEAAVVEVTGRELKERYGIFAYVMAALQTLREPQTALYQLNIDGRTVECEGLTCLIANAGSLGVPGLSLSPAISVDDGLLDVFVIRKADLAGIVQLAASIMGAAEKIENMPHWQAREVSIVASPVQSVQGDGDLLGQSPIRCKVLPRALKVIVPEHPALPTLL